MEETVTTAKAGMEAMQGRADLLARELEAARVELAVARQREDRLAADHRLVLDALASRPLAALVGWVRDRLRKPR